MLDTSNSANPFVKPSDAIEETSDAQFIEENDDYKRRNIFKWFWLALLMVCFSCTALLFLWKLFTDNNVQSFVINQIKNNIIFILITGCAILRIDIPNLKR